ncbi:MAG TPA: ABC-F type ribosomal protection protein [Desulfitobacterium dehalogenans]|uniref:ABC-F type ribosomal protection protein n=1 Tax=Desulfitobacterium dehalogenans TaxID=36854 RepID=A0A7C7D4C4_9FIRM|nr:ABC-F type ribosomal protection protein [Desulfitobacterium dehalogenans]
MIACSVNKVTKMFGGNIIFSNISLEIQENERVGLVGPNGSGKTTLFKLLAGQEDPDAGHIHWKKGLKIGYLMQIPDFEDGLTAKEVLMTAYDELLEMEEKMRQLEEAMSLEQDQARLNKLMESYGHYLNQFTLQGGYEIEPNLEKIAHGLNIRDLLPRDFSTLSGGEKTKVGLALTLLRNPDFLLLDEPTNHLDLFAVKWLGSFLKNYRGTVLVISHDRFFLDEVATKILDLADGELASYHTNYTGYVKEKEERLLKEFHDYEEQQKKIKKMKEAIKRLREWANRANPPNEGLHRQARNIERALERMEKLTRPQLIRKKINLEMEASERSGKDVVLLQGVAKGFGQQLLFTHVNIHLSFGQRAAIVGENGTGKSTLIKLILQELSPDEGKVSIGSNVKIGYLSQHVFSDAKEETVLDSFRTEIPVAEGEARSILARFLFYGPMVYKKVSQLSGGERMRLRLAQLMYQDTNLLILDEPTNHLDIDSLQVLEDALENYDGTLLAVSHDRYFLNKLFNKVYWIETGVLHHFEGNFDYAEEKMKALLPDNTDIFNERSNEKVSNQSGSRSLPVKNKVTRDHSLEELESELKDLEEKISSLDLELQDIGDLERLQQVYAEKEGLEKRWHEIFDLLE